MHQCICSRAKRKVKEIYEFGNHRRLSARRTRHRRACVFGNEFAPEQSGRAAADSVRGKRLSVAGGAASVGRRRWPRSNIYVPPARY